MISQAEFLAERERLMALSRKRESALVAERDRYKAALESALKALDGIAHPGPAEDHNSAMGEAVLLALRIETALRGGGE